MVEPTLEEISASLSNHPTFVILAETLAAWRSPATPEGREVLHQHYLWGSRMRERGLLLFAGPLDVEQMAPGGPSPVGQLTGLLVFRAASKAEAETLAHDDPFHRAGYRKNVVCSWSIRFLQPEISAAIGQALAAPTR